jgi:hypothetical protein
VLLPYWYGTVLLQFSRELATAAGILEKFRAPSNEASIHVIKNDICHVSRSPRVSRLLLPVSKNNSSGSRVAYGTVGYRYLKAVYGYLLYVLTTPYE